MSLETVERIAKVEAILQRMQEELDRHYKELKELHVVFVRITSHSEKLKNLKKQTAYILSLVQREQEERLVHSRAVGKRVGDIEAKMQVISDQTVINSHGRSMIEKVAIPIIAGIAGSIATILLTMWLVAPSGPPTP